MSKFPGLSLAVDKPQRMTIVNPLTGEPLVAADGELAWISLYSNDSEVARKHRSAAISRRLGMRTRARATPEELEKEAVDLLVALTADWRLLNLDGSDAGLPFSQADARDLYSSPDTAWLREQVDIFIGDRAKTLGAERTAYSMK